MTGLKLYVGLMSGTSADSIDAVLVDLTSNTPQLLATHSADIKELKPEIHALACLGENEIHRMCQLDRELGLRFAQATNELVLDLGLAVLAACLNALAVGAPLVPAFHQAVFEKPGFSRAIVNIGGMANITLLTGDNSPSSLLGYDTGPGNALMDSWTNLNLNQPFDKNGRWAAQGQVIDHLLQQLLDTTYLSQPAPKSTGPELFNITWLTEHLQQQAEFSAVDVEATLLEFTAHTISAALKSHAPVVRDVFFCGGGAYNTALMQRLETLLHPMLIASTAQLGIAPEWVEAVAFAWLAQQTLEGRPGNAPSVTGASKASVLGAIYLA